MSPHFAVIVWKDVFKRRRPHALFPVWCIMTHSDALWALEPAGRQVVRNPTHHTSWSCALKARCHCPDGVSRFRKLNADYNITGKCRDQCWLGSKKLAKTVTPAVSRWTELRKNRKRNEQWRAPIEYWKRISVQKISMQTCNSVHLSFCFTCRTRKFAPFILLVEGW